MYAAVALPLQGGGSGRGREGGVGRWGDVPRLAIHAGSAFSHAAALLFRVSTRKGKKEKRNTHTVEPETEAANKTVPVLKFDICAFNLRVFLTF